MISEDHGLWNKNYKLPTPIADEIKFTCDLIFQVPWENNYKIWLSCLYLNFAENWDSASRQEPTLPVW